MTEWAVDDWSDRPVAVAGATGFIGAALSRELSKRGAQVTVVGRSADAGSAGAGVSALRADLTEPESAGRMCAGQHTVFLAAALDGNADYKARHTAEIIRSNSLITLNVLQAALDQCVNRVVLVSSYEVYAATGGELLSDALPVESISNLNTYAVSKLFGELAALKYVEQFGLAVSIGRPANVYGPGDDASAARGRVIARWISVAAGGKPLEIWGTGNEARSYIFVDDVVRGLIRLAEAGPAGKPVNLAHPESISLRHLAERILAIGGFDVPIVLTPRHGTSIETRLLDTSLASDLLGFTASVGLDEGLRLTIREMRRLPAQREGGLGTLRGS